MGDKVMKPKNQDRGSAIKGPKSSTIESFTPTSEYLTPYTRKGGKKK